MMCVSEKEKLCIDIYVDIVRFYTNTDTTVYYTYYIYNDIYLQNNIFFYTRDKQLHQHM